MDSRASGPSRPKAETAGYLSAAFSVFSYRMSDLVLSSQVLAWRAEWFTSGRIPNRIADISVVAEAGTSSFASLSNSRYLPYDFG